MSTALVTEGAGFIDGWVLDQLLRDEDRFVVNVHKLAFVADPVGAARRSERPSRQLECVDICAPARPEPVPERLEPDVIPHLAAESPVDRSIESPPVFIDTDNVGTYSPLGATLAYWSRAPGQRRERFRFLNVSSEKAYGSLGPQGKLTESIQYRPNSAYAANKAAADHFARAWHGTYRLPVVVTHCSNNYGRTQFPEKLIPLMTIKAPSGEGLPTTTCATGSMSKTMCARYSPIAMRVGSGRLAISGETARR